VASGEITTTPFRSRGTPEFERAVSHLVPLIESAAPRVPSARWIAIRLLDGDAAVEEALASGQLAELVARQQAPDLRFSRKIALQGAQ
jgi:GTP-binding protein